MRLLSKSNYTCFTYKINMEELISSIYHLVVDIFIERRNSQPFNECITDLFNIDEICEIKQLTESTTKDSFLFDIVSFLEEGLYSTFDYFSNTNVFLLYRERNLIIIKGADKSSAQKVISNWIKRYNPIERIFDVIKDANLQKHKESICSLLTDANYARIVKIERTEVLESTLIPKEWINFDSFRISPIDNSSIWIDKHLTSIVGEISTINLNEVTHNNGENIGLTLGDYFLPLNNIDTYIVKQNAVNYFWRMLKEVYSPAKSVASAVPNIKQLKPFIEKCKESDFCKLLSFLHHNLYIKGNEKNIPSQFMHLFEEVYSISGLEYLSNFCFYTGIPNTTSSQTLLGVYEYEKNSSEYNLLNWVNHAENDKHKITRCNNCIEKESQKVYALLPQYSYYFMSKYFENVFTQILKELECDYATNVHLSKTSDPKNDFIEIDALVKKNDHQIVYFENKTTLSKFNIDDTICKIEKFHSFLLDAYPDLTFEYIIISPYCDETIKESYWYFAKNGYEAREDIKHYTYNFVIPLAKFDNISLRCIVEPEYEKMKTLINSIIR